MADRAGQSNYVTSQFFWKSRIKCIFYLKDVVTGGHVFGASGLNSSAESRMKCCLTISNCSGDPTLSAGPRFPLVLTHRLHTDSPAFVGSWPSAPADPADSDLQQFRSKTLNREWQREAGAQGSNTVTLGPTLNLFKICFLPAA